MPRSIYAVVSMLAFLATLLIATVPAIAQVDRGAIVGTVTDPSGARISNAQITITSLETSQSVHLTTGEEGNYNANLLKIGTYSVSATKQGFGKTVQASVDVPVNQSIRVDLVLKLGAASETVEVTGAAPLSADRIVFAGHGRDGAANLRPASQRQKLHPTRVSRSRGEWRSNRNQRQRRRLRERTSQ